jgi:hypothetical protein
MSIERIPSEHPEKSEGSASSIDHSSKTPDSLTSPPATAEQVTEPVGSKPWDISAPAAEGPDQRRGTGRESPREQSTVEKLVTCGAVVLTGFGSGGELQGRPGAISRTETPIVAGQASQVRDDVQVTSQPPPNVAEVGSVEETHNPPGPEHGPEGKPERERDHFGPPQDDPRVRNYARHEDLRPTTRDRPRGRRP